VEVWQDVFLMIRRLRVLSETLCKLLENCSGHADVFRLGEESSCPDSVALFERFIWEVGFQVRRQVRHRFVFLIGIFYKGWEASPAGIYPFNVFPFGVPLHLAVGLATYTAAQKAPSHLDGSGAQVDLWVILVQPGESEYHALLAEVCDYK